MNNYSQYTFEIPENTDKDIIISILYDHNFEGFVETENGFLAYIQEENDTSDWQNEIFNINDSIKFSKEKIEPKNWNEEWEKSYDIAIINDDCEIYAPFHTIRQNIKYPLLIEPKMSFGTGHHPTTFMMCNLLFEYKNNLQNKNILDDGCGTGILGILAKKLGADKICSIDNDMICIENTNENIQKNIPHQQINDFVVTHSDIQSFRKTFPDKKFDFILANIQKDVIQKNLSDYIEILNPDGYLIISGILKDYETEMIVSAKPLHHITTKYKNEWIALVFQKIKK